MPVSGSAWVLRMRRWARWLHGVWDGLLLLEYALAGSTVAVGFSGYLVSLLATFGVHVPPEVATPLIQSITVPGGYRFVSGGGINLIAGARFL